MDDRTEQHINIVAWLNIAQGALIVALAILFISILALVGDVTPDGMTPSAAELVTSIGSILGFIFLVLSAPFFMAGYGLLKRREWGRILGIVVGALSLINVPLGTAFGAYAIWTLTRPEAIDSFF